MYDFDLLVGIMIPITLLLEFGIFIYFFIYLFLLFLCRRVFIYMYHSLLSGSNHFLKKALDL